GVEREALLAVEVTRRGIDARRRNARFVFHLVVTLREGIAPARKKFGEANIEPFVDEPSEPPAPTPRAKPDLPVVVIGAGPGGLFAAHRLLDAGVPCLLLERGAP